MTSTTLEAKAPSRIIPWWVVLIEGIAAIIFGVYLLVQPGMAIILLVQILGFYWLFTGILSLFSLFWDRTAWGWKLFSGILGIIVGLLIIQHPLVSAILVPATLVWVVGFLGIFMGISNLIQAFRGAGWGAGILGVLSIILGLILIARPLLATISLPFVLGIFGIFGGILALIAAFQLKGAQGKAEAVAAETIAPQVVEPETSRFEEVKLEETEAVEEAAEEPVEQAVELPDMTLPENMEKFRLDLSYIEGIGAVYSEKLKTAGVNNPLDLLHKGATRKGRQEIADATGITLTLILEWVNHVDLFRIKGVGSEYADLLEEAGVDTVPELAQRNSANLFDKIVALNEEKKLVRRLPDLTQVEDWVTQAKNLPRVINY